MLQPAGIIPTACPAPARHHGRPGFWLRAALLVARDVCAALFVGLLIGALILRAFGVVPRALLGFWALLSLI